MIACILIVTLSILTIMWAVGRETAERFVINDGLTRMTRLDDEMDLHDAADTAAHNGSEE